jgi:hypothetical protein
MILWDSNHLIPFNDVAEVQEPPTEFLDVHTRGRSEPVQTNPTTTQLSRGNQEVDHSKPIFSSQKNPTNIHTHEAPKLDYNVVEELKKMKDNLFVMDMCRIPQQKDFLLHSLKSIESLVTSIDLSEVPSPIDLKNKMSVNDFSLDKRGQPFVPPFLLKFEVFNRNLRNFLLDSRASSNVVPLPIYKKLNNPARK